jgi:hypothetical protein
LEQSGQFRCRGGRVAAHDDHRLFWGQVQQRDLLGVELGRREYLIPYREPGTAVRGVHVEYLRPGDRREAERRMHRVLGIVGHPWCPMSQK